MSKAVVALSALGKTQQQLADELGVTQPHISRVFAGEREAGVELRRAANKRYGIDWGAWDEPEAEAS